MCHIAYGSVFQTALKNWARGGREGEVSRPLPCEGHKMGYSSEGQWSLIQASNGKPLPLLTLNSGLLSKF